MGVVRFYVGVVFLSIIARGSYGLYENNPFLSNQSKVVPVQNTLLNSTQNSSVPNNLKQNIQQIAVVLPPGVHLNNTHQPGTIIINIPSYVPQTPVNVPSVAITQPPTSPAQPTKPLEPQPKPEGNLNKKCLKPRGQFPSSKCNKFVNCWDGLAVEQFCPVGLAFNPAGFCDYAYNVDCKGKPFEALPAPETPPSAGSPDIIAPPERDPSVKPPQHTTTSPPIYRPPVDTSPPIYIPIGSTPDENLKKKCLGPRGLFPSKYCNKFVNCWDGFAVEQDCPPGLSFSDKGYCDYDYNVNCDGRIILASTTQSPPINTQPDVIKPKPPQPVTVTQPTYKPPQTSVVTLPPQTQKPPATIAPPVTPIYIPPGIISDDKLKKKCLKPRGQFLSDVCNKYVNCWDGFVVEQDCPPGLLFSEKGYCDYPYNVDCKKRIIVTTIQPAPPQNLWEPDRVKPHQTTVIETDKQTTLPQPAGVASSTPSPVPQQPGSPTLPFIPPVSVTDENLKKKCSGLRGQFPSDSCHTYIDCWDQFAVERDCPPGLLFSEKGFCDFAYNVNCLNRTAIKTTPDPSCPIPNGTFRDKSNCSRYYTCTENTVTVKYECPAGLHYNDVIGVCDYAYRVDCSREPFIYQPKSDFLQKVPAGLLDATAGCTPGQVFRLNVECTSAALCRNRVTEVIHCPAGLAYDAPSDRCLPLQLARCQNL